MLLRISLLVLLSLSFCSCRVYLPSLKRFAIDSNHSYIYSKVKYEGILVLADKPDTHHARYMHEILVDIKGIPGENIVLMRDFLGVLHSPVSAYSGGNFGLSSLLFDDEYAYSHLRSEVRVVCAPFRVKIFGTLHDQVSWIDGSNILFVVSAGNTNHFGGSRDVLRPDHEFFQDDPRADFNLYKKILATDHLIIASSLGFQWDSNRENITFFPGSENVKCGETKENCFSVAGYRPRYEPDDERFYDHDGFSTSEATATLSAISFYLAQFYPTAEEIVSTLRSCAIDVGEPGVDEEYGVGLVNLFCPEVLEKEMATAVSSSQVSEESHTLTALTQPLPETFSLFSSVGLDFYGMQGHVGVSYATQSLQAVALAGFGRSSLGIYSDLYYEQNMFFELGVRKPLTPHLSFIGTYGHQYGNLSVDSVRAGLHAVRQIGRMQASAYIGRHMFRCSLGLPGYQAAGARKVSFSRGVWEARFSLAFSL